MQIQISGCTSYCQGVSQVQQAVQSNATLQSVGAAGQLASVLEVPPASGAISQITSTTTQTQLGCLSSCFGTTTPGSSSAAVTALVLSELSSLLPPTAASVMQPTPANEQNVVQQVVCQVEQAGPAGAQVQSATQINTTVQITQRGPGTAGLEPAGAPAPAPETTDQTQQQVWQLQVGCLFYCVDSQQVQQAQQSTTIEIVAPSGAVTVAVVQQTVWQLQIGCLEWCWDSTQVQEASTTAIVVSQPSDAGPAPPPDPAPTPGPAPEPAPGDSPVSATEPPPEAPGPAPPPSAPVPTGTRGTVIIAVGRSPQHIGLAILRSWSANTVASSSSAALTVEPLTTAPRSMPAGIITDAPAELHTVRSSWHARPTPVRHTARASAGPHVPGATDQAKATVAEGDPLPALLLAAVGLIVLAVLVSVLPDEEVRR